MFMSHLLGQFEQRPAERHVGRCHARLLEHGGDFRVRQTQLDARDDQGLVVGPQAIERGLVAIERLLADGQIQGRVLLAGEVVVEGDGGPFSGTGVRDRGRGSTAPCARSPETRLHAAG
jgi:hypothetical protein